MKEELASCANKLGQAVCDARQQFDIGGVREIGAMANECTVAIYENTLQFLLSLDAWVFNEGDDSVALAKCCQRIRIGFIENRCIQERPLLVPTGAAATQPMQVIDSG